MSAQQIAETARGKGSPAEQTAYLNEVCGGDPALRQRVEDLLRNQEPTAAPEGLDFLQPAATAGVLGRLAHYEVQEVLGKGSFGIVLKAFDEKLQRLVAIKVLGPQVAGNATARQRFVREARAAAAVRDPHVIKVFEVEECPRPYLVMEYVQGQTLQDRIDRGGPLDLKEIMQIGAQVAAGLAAAHRQGEIHRDIKPANILLEVGQAFQPDVRLESLTYHVKITDFGLAKAVDDARLTQQGEIIGTPLYMSPEQARGAALDQRSDLFSLGTVLYTLCTGVQPFRAAKVLGVLKRVCEDTPRPIREVNPNIPDFLSAIVHKLLAKDPGERFQTAAEVAGLLKGHLAQLESPAGPPSSFGVEADIVANRRPEWEAWGARAWRRRWVLAGSIAALATGIGLLVYLDLAGRGRPRREELVSRERERPENAPVAHAPGSPLQEAGLPPAKPADEAAELAALTAALEKDPKNAGVYFDRATWYARRGRWQECAKDFQARIELLPQDPIPWVPPAAAMLLAGDVEGYRGLCRRMIEQYRGTQDARDAGLVLKVCLLLPGSSTAGLPREILAKALDRGEVRGSRLSWAAAARGLAAYRAGDYPEAVRWSSKVEASAYDGRCGVLALLIRALAEHQLRRPDEARRAFLEAATLVPGELRTLGPGDPTGQRPVGSSVVHHDWLVAEILRREAEGLLFPDLPAFLKGEHQPRDNAERLVLTAGCRARGEHLEAARLYAGAFAVDPQLAEDRQAAHRYTAALCAVRVRAAAGAAPLDDQEKARWRRQALHWLKDDLAGYTWRLEGGTAEDRAEVLRTLRLWQRDPELARVRAPDALARLPAEEREEWLKLWAEVAALVAKTPDKSR